MPKQPKELSKEEKAVADDIERTISADSLGVRANPSVNSDTVPSKWLNPDYKLNENEIKQAKQIIKEFNKDDVRQGVRNGVVWGETPEARAEGERIQALQNKINPVAAFASGMLKRATPIINGAVESIPSALRSIPTAIQNIPKLGEEIVNAGSSDWINDQQKEEGTKPFINAKESLKNATAGMEQNLNNVANDIEPAINKAVENSKLNMKNVETQNPLVYGAGDAAEQMTEQIMWGSLLPEIPGLNPHVSNMITGQIADNLVQIGPDTLEKYNNGMRGNDLVQEVLKDEAENALWNVGGEFVIPSLFKGIGKGINAIANKNTAQVAEDVVENAAKSAPTELPKLAEPEALAKQNAEGIDALANQQRQAAETIQDFSKEIPEVPAQERSVFDTLIDARRNGTTNSREAVDAINAVEKRDKEVLSAAEQYTNDPEVKRLVDEVGKYQEKSWENLLDVENPVNAEVIKGHEQALNNLERYMSENAPNIPVQPVKNNYGDSIRESIKGLEMPDNVRSEVEGSLANIDGIFPRIDNAKSADEVNAILDEVKATINNADAALQKNAATRNIGKYDFDESTKNLAEAINGKRIYITPEMKAELNFTNVSKLNDSLAFKSNGKIYKPKFTTNATTGTPIDTIFPELDAATGGAISNFMRNNGMDPDNTANMAKGISDYVSYLKANKDAVKVQKYSGGMFDDFMESVQKVGDDKLNKLNKTMPLNLQFFAEKVEAAKKALANMPEGAEKEQFKDSLKAFEAKLRNAKTEEEAKKVWELSKVRKTMEKSGIFTEDELKNVIPEEDLKYFRQGEEVPYEAVKKRINEDYNGMLTKYTQKFDSKEAAVKELGNAEDINGMYIMAKDRLEKARTTDNPALKRVLYAEARGIMLNLRKANTELGRAIQANAKVARTPERTVMDALGFAEEKVSNALEKDPNLKKGIEQVTEQIDNFLKDMDTKAMKREEIEDMINSALLKNKRVRSRIGKGDVQKIADAIMNEKQYVDIQKQLEFLSTGFGDVDAKTMDQVQKMFEAVQNLPFNSKKRVDMENEAYKLLALKICPRGGTFRDKFDAWRYLAMLANPTTHEKNVVGNVLFGKGMVSAKNTLGALIEEAADRVSKVAGKGGIDRTKTILTPKDAKLIAAAKEDGLENAFRELSGNKYLDAGSSIDQAIPAFNTKTPLGRFLNRAAEINAGALSKEDEMAMMSKYKTSLAGYLKANGADESIFKATDDKSITLLENAREYAINQAKEAAFHQDTPFMSKFSNFTRDLRNGTKGEQTAGLILDTIVPFKKTPANILKSAFAYSPLEYAKVIMDLDALNKGVKYVNGKYVPFKAANFIDDISKATTGTAALGIGYLLAHEGILKIGSDLSDEETSFDKQTGRQTVSIKVGNKYVPIQELIPSAAPLIFGGTIYETLANKTDKDTALNTLFSGTGAIANGVIDMSMLSGITDTLSSVRGAKDSREVVTNLGLKTGSNLASQLLPTLGRKVNVTLDDTKRSTYSDKEGASKQIDQNVKYLQTKIPGLQQAGEALKKSDNATLQKVGSRLALEPNVDVKGQVQNSPGHAGIDNIGGRVINNFLSPLNVTKDTSTKYDEERRRLEKVTGESKVLPYIATDEAKIGDRKLTPEEWTDYRKTRGQLREKIAEGVIDSKEYKNMSDADRAAILTNVDSFTKAVAQNKYGKDMSSDNQKLADIYKKKGVDGLIHELTFKAAKKNNGLSDSKAVRETYEKQGTEGMKKFGDVQKELASYGAKNSSETVKYYNHAKQTIPSLTPKDYVGYLHKIGGTDYKISQDELLEYANVKGLSESKMNTYWNAFGEWSRIPKLNKNGEWTVSKK